MTPVRLAPLALLCLAGATPAAAHGGGQTGFAEVSVHGQTIRYSLTLGPDVMDGAGFARAVGAEAGGEPDYDRLAGVVERRIAVAADGRPCAATPGSVTPPSGVRARVVATVHFACAAPVGELVLRDDLAEAFGADYHTLASFEGPSGAQQVVFEAGRREARIQMGGLDPADAGAASGGGGPFLRGVEHVLLGLDHLLLTLALILPGGGVLPLLAIVTAFAGAHGVTTALAALGTAAPAGFVAPAMAIAVVGVALANLFGASAARARVAIACALGLLHGFDLPDPGPPSEGLFVSVLGFSLGLEAGQALVVALVAPLLFWPWSVRPRAFAATASSAAVLVGGLSLLATQAVS